MAQRTRPPRWYHRYVPAASPSARPVSVFALSCDFEELAASQPEFRDALLVVRRGRKRRRGDDDGDGDGSSPTPTPPSPASGALSARTTHPFNASLARALLRRHFRLEMPSLPPGRLCPPVPNRANYVRWIGELLKRSRGELYRFAAASSRSNAGNGDGGGGDAWQRRGIDIGTGVSAIYPLLLTTELFAGSDAFSGDAKSRNDDEGDGAAGEGREASSREWTFLATDVDPLAIRSARANVAANRLEDRIRVVQVGEGNGPLRAAMEEARLERDRNTGETSGGPGGRPKFDFVMTNPPFYSTSKEATDVRAGDGRSRTGMSAGEGVYAPANRYGPDGDVEDDRDAGSAPTEEGGDVGFVTAIMNDSQLYREDVTWYTSLIAKRSSLDAVLRRLRTLDGVWGNRGQVRTVEFRQGNIHGGSGDGSGEDDECHGGPRVRWGVGWTYERAVGRCGVCRVRGGLQSFEVSIDVGVVPDGADEGSGEASDEAASRLVAYFEGLRDFSLKCSRRWRRMASETSDGGGERRGNGRGGPNRRERLCVTAVEGRFFGGSGLPRPPVPDPDSDNGSLPHEGHFLIDAFVECAGRSDDGGGGARVRVLLEMYSHTNYGSDAVDKIRGPLPGEVGRTNRRWRRLRKRKGVAHTNWSTWDRYPPLDPPGEEGYL